MKSVKVLVATKEKQGVRKNDFSHADEGHIATFGFVCDGATPDDKCGCARAMVTPSNAKATTTVKVVERTLAQMKQSVDEIIKHYVKNWNMSEAEAVTMANEDLAENARIASSFDLNAVLEIRGSKIQARA